MTNEDMDALAWRATAAAAAWSPGCSVKEVHALESGYSSRTYVAAVAGAPPGNERMVVKVAPAGLPPVKNRDVLRQARLLRAVFGSPGVRVPRVLFEDPGAPPEVPPLFGMTFVEGDSFEPHLERTDTFPPDQVIEPRAREAARMLAAFHAIDPAAAGLGEEPEVSLSDEIDRWVTANATVDEDLKPGADEVATILRARMPDPVVSTLVHGDYRLGNTLCHGPNVRAIIDWEIWARSDPRIDLAWFLIAARPDLHPSAVRDMKAMPRWEELQQEYVDAGGASTDRLEWFTAHALFKVASVTALLAKRYRKKGEVPEFIERAASHVPEMIARARVVLEE
ncbi:MAG: phosphotransferase family protein [Actinomycetota bacterium]